PGWVSDAFRQTSAQSETAEPHSGTKNGVCRTTTSLDCGIYQDVVAPVNGLYTLTTYANASRGGALVGWNVNEAFVASASVTAGSPGAYSASPFTPPPPPPPPTLACPYPPPTPPS